MLVISVMMLMSPVQAEVVTWEEALTVADNWITLIIQNDGDWGGAEWAQVEEIEEFKREERLLGYFFRVWPQEYIVVSLRKEMAPVKAYSAISDLVPEFDESMTDFIKSGMEHTLDKIEGQVGPSLLAETQDLQEVVETDYRPDWEKLGLDPELFEGGLKSGAVLMNYAGGEPPLLTSNWHQNDPYNRKCPAGYEGPLWNRRKVCDNCPAGCGPIAAAQIMRYWAWPPYKESFTVSYDWRNIIDRYLWDENDKRFEDGNGNPVTQAQIDAVAQLCYDVGDEAGTDYECDGSSTRMGGLPGKDIRDAFADQFRYHDNADLEMWIGESQASWFEKIKDNLYVNRPVVYGFGLTLLGLEGTGDKEEGHIMVCDGWKEVGSSRQLHMNYGHGGTNDGWYTLDAFSGREAIIRGIRPEPSLGNWINGSYPKESFQFRYFNQDCSGHNVSFGAGQFLQFLPGISVKCSSPNAGEYIEFAGWSGEPGLHTVLYSRGDTSKGIKIYSGRIKLYLNSSIKFH